MQLTLTQNGGLYLAHHKISKRRRALFRHLRTAGRKQSLICDGRLSSTPPSCGDFIWTTVAERGRILEPAVMRRARVVRHSAAQSLMSKPRASRSSDQEVMQHLSRSQIFKDYEGAFSEAMGLPLNIRGHDSWSPSHHGKEDHGSFASILARFNKARSACLRAQTEASREPDSTTRIVTWFAGLSESAVPVYVGDPYSCFLETGEVMLKNPTKKHFATITRQLRAWGYKTDWTQLERAYFRTCVLSPDRYGAMLRLLSIFAQHLSILSKSIGRTARTGRIREHGASAAIHREASGGAGVAGASSPGG